MKVVLDTNIVLDVVLQRADFALESANVIGLVESGRLAGVICATSVTTVYYVVEKAHGEMKARQAIRRLLQVLDVAPVDRATLVAALDAPGTDFEDDVIIEAAIRAGASVIVTRDGTGFQGARCEVMSPGKLLEAIVGRT